jgi:hypothetical protein
MSSALPPTNAPERSWVDKAESGSPRLIADYPRQGTNNGNRHGSLTTPVRSNCGVAAAGTLHNFDLRRPAAHHAQQRLGGSFRGALGAGGQCVGPGDPGNTPFIGGYRAGGGLVARERGRVAVRRAQEGRL